MREEIGSWAHQLPLHSRKWCSFHDNRKYKTHQRYLKIWSKEYAEELNIATYLSPPSRGTLLNPQSSFVKPASLVFPVPISIETDPIFPLLLCVAKGFNELTWTQNDLLWNNFLRKKKSILFSGLEAKRGSENKKARFLGESGVRRLGWISAPWKSLQRKHFIFLSANHR